MGEAVPYLFEWSKRREGRQLAAEMGAERAMRKLAARAGDLRRNEPYSHNPALTGNLALFS